MIVQVTTESLGTYSPTEQIALVRELRPEAASIALREIVPDAAHEAAFANLLYWMRRERIFPQIILYDRADMERLVEFHRRGLLAAEEILLLFVLGRYTTDQQSQPADLIQFLANVPHGFTHWPVCAFGRQEAACAVDTALMGGNVRVGFENNLHLPNGDVAESNAELVLAVTEHLRVLGLPVSTADMQREALALWSCSPTTACTTSSSTISPALCIGVCESYESPIEHWLKAKRRVFTGDQAFGAYLLQEALKADFDPAFLMEMVLDHGPLTPLGLAGLDPDLPIVPILFNCVQPPMPTMRRCCQFGKFLGEVIRRYDGAERVAILATGGISHDIATPRMGMVNRAFDETLLQLMEAGEPEAVVKYATDEVHTAGNGAEEIRIWMAAMGAAGGLPFKRAYYKAINDWYTGIGIGHFGRNSQAAVETVNG